MLIMPATIVGDWQYSDTADIVDTTAVEAMAAKTGARHLVTGIQATNTDTAVGTVIQILSASTVIGQVMVGPYVAAAPGASYAEASYFKPLKGGSGEAINIKCVTTSAQVRCSLQGVTVVA